MTCEEVKAMNGKWGDDISLSTRAERVAVANHLRTCLACHLMALRSEAYWIAGPHREEFLLTKETTRAVLMADREFNDPEAQLR